MKRLILVFAMVMALLVPASAAQNCPCEVSDAERALELMAPEVEVYTIDEWEEGAPITLDRDGRLVFVKMIGTVTNGETGEGRDEDGCFVDYDPGEFETGAVVETWLLANPATDYFDDFIARWAEVVSDAR